MLERALHKDSCNEVIELALRIPEIQVVAVGPESCLRVLFFRAARKNLLDRFNMLFVDSLDLVTNRHPAALQEGLARIIEAAEKQAKRIQGFVVYVSCADLLTGTNFSGVKRSIEKNYRIPVAVFQRGPLAKRKMPPKERLSLILAELTEFYRKEDNKPRERLQAVNILGEEKTSPGSDLGRVIQQAGFTQINDLADLSAFEQLLAMTQSSRSIVTHPFALRFAEYLAENYRIPYLFLPGSEDSRENSQYYRRLAEFLQVENDKLRRTNIKSGMTALLPGSKGIGEIR